jgi:hypothetical protein
VRVETVPETETPDPLRRMIEFGEATPPIFIKPLLGLEVSRCCAACAKGRGPGVRRGAHRRDPPAARPER